MHGALQEGCKLLKSDFHMVITCAEWKELLSSVQFVILEFQIMEFV